MQAELLSTDRLQLRSPAVSDFDDLFDRVLSDPGVMRYVFGGVTYEREQALEFWNAEFDHQSSGRKLGVLIERCTKQIIGFAGLVPCGALSADDLELGFVLAQTAWGKGYATEIGRAQTDYALARSKLPRVLALASPTNAGSLAVLSKIGMQFHTTINAGGRGERHVFVAEA